jgi:hypothetical protein
MNATQTDAEFFRVRLSDPKLTRGEMVYVRSAKEPIPSANKKIMLFRLLSLTNEKAEAGVYLAAAAAAAISILQVSYPTAELEPATFGEWVLANPDGPHQ